MRTSQMIAVGLALVGWSGCSGDPASDGIADSFVDESGKADTGGIHDGTADAVSVLQVANQLSEDDLVSKVGLAKRAAEAIAAVRLGDDGEPGTSDDQTFQTLAQLDAVPYVGPIAFQHLLTYAKSSSVAPSYGFVEDYRAAAQGSGSITEKVGPGCRFKTLNWLLCGGWVSVTSDHGKTQVALGAIGHDDYYEYVSGHSYPFPPPADNRFWQQSALVELDSSGYGQFERPVANAGGYIGTLVYQVRATQGAITVDYDGTLEPGSCYSYHETCSFRAVMNAH